MVPLSAARPLLDSPPLSSDLAASPPAGALVVGAAALVVVATLGAAESEESLPDEHAAMARVRAAAAPASRRSRFMPATTTDPLLRFTEPSGRRHRTSGRIGR
jgi:hypothetical protein